MHQWSLAVERVRYAGEPVALVVAESRYLAEDAAELVEIEYDAARGRHRSGRGLQARTRRCCIPEAKTNEISVREFTLRRHQGRVRKGRQDRQADGAVPPAVVHADGVLRRRRLLQSRRRQLRLHGQLPGPFSTHPVMAKALRVPGPKMRLRIPPDSGGSFGIKLRCFRMWC